MKPFEWILFAAMCLFLGPLGIVAGSILFTSLAISRSAAAGKTDY